MLYVQSLASCPVHSVAGLFFNGRNTNAQNSGTTAMRSTSLSFENNGITIRIIPRSMSVRTLVIGSIGHMYHSKEECLILIAFGTQPETGPSVVVTSTG